MDIGQTISSVEYARRKQTAEKHGNCCFRRAMDRSATTVIFIPFMRKAAPETMNHTRAIGPIFEAFAELARISCVNVAPLVAASLGVDCSIAELRATILHARVPATFSVSVG